MKKYVYFISYTSSSIHFGNGEFCFDKPIKYLEQIRDFEKREGENIKRGLFRVLNYKLLRVGNKKILTSERMELFKK